MNISKKIIPVIFILLILSTLFIVNAQEIVTKQQASEALAKAEQDMLEMQEEGFSIIYINDTLLLAKESFDNAEYEKVLTYCNEIATRKEKAYELNDKILLNGENSQ